MKAALLGAAILILGGCNLFSKANNALQNMQNGNNVPLGGAGPQGDAPAPAPPNAPPAAPPVATPDQRAALSRGFAPHDVALESDPANERISALQIIARDPTLLGDEARLKMLMLGMQKVAEQKVTEFDPYRLHPPGDAQLVENETLHQTGWSIAKTGWDPARKVYILNWVRIRPATPADMNQ